MIGQELDMETYGGDTREEADIHAEGVKWRKKGQNISRAVRNLGGF